MDWMQKETNNSVGLFARFLHTTYFGCIYCISDGFWRCFINSSNCLGLSFFTILLRTLKFTTANGLCNCDTTPRGVTGSYDTSFGMDWMQKETNNSVGLFARFLHTTYFGCIYCISDGFWHCFIKSSNCLASPPTMEAKSTVSMGAR